MLCFERHGVVLTFQGKAACKGARSSRCSVVRRWHGHSPPTRNRRIGCGALACSKGPRQAIRTGSVVSLRSAWGWPNSDGWEPASRVLGLMLKSIPIQNAGDIDAALRSAMQTQAVVTMDDPVIQSNRGRIVDWGMRERIPVMGEFRPMAAAGALMTYGPNQVDLWRRSAAY